MIGAATVLLQGNALAAASSFTFTATTPAANRRLLAAVWCVRLSGPIVPISFTAFGVTWSLVNTVLSGLVRLTVYEADEADSGSSPSGTSVNVNVNDGDGGGDGVHRRLARSARATSPAKTTSGVVAFAASASSPVAGWTPGGGYTEALDYAIHTSGAHRLTYVYAAEASGNPTATAASSSDLVAIGIELARRHGGGV